MHALTKMFAEIATKDWSHHEDFIMFVINWNAEKEGIKLSNDQVRHLCAGFGRTCGARGGATTLVSAGWWPWRAHLRARDSLAPTRDSCGARRTAPPVAT